MSGLVKSITKSTAVALLALGFVALLLALTIAGEIPTGRVTGLVLDEEGRPMARATVALYSSDNNARMRAVTSQDGRFVITDVPVGNTYFGYATMRGYFTSYLSEGGKIKVLEGKTTDTKPAKLQIRPADVYTYIPGVFMPGERVKFTLRGYSRQQIAAPHISVYRYDFAEHVRGQKGGSDPYDDDLTRWKNIGAPVCEIDERIKTDGEGYFAKDVALPVQEIGGYLVHIRLESTESLGKLLISDLALVAKRAPEKTLIYATSFGEKRPLSGVKLEFFTSGGKLEVSGVTDADGLFSTDALPKDSVTILGSFGQSSAVNQSYRGDSDEQYKCYMFTDRPVYRPGHKVSFKGVLRKSQPGSYTPVADQSVSVKIEDGDGNQVRELNLATDHYGSFLSSIDLDTRAATGSYSIIAQYAGEKHSASFMVEEYRKPEFKTSIRFGKPSYVGGKKIRATVEATYYFGAPVAGAKVTYTVYKSRDYFWYYPDEGSDTSFYDEFFAESESEEGYYGGYGEVVSESEGVTDENGLLTVDIPTRKTGHEERYAIEASVMDPSGRSVDASGGVQVTPGLYAIVLDTDRYVYKTGTAVTVTAYAVDYQRRRVPNVSASFTAYSHKGGAKRGGRIASRTVRFDRDGKATFTFRPRREGEYSVVARSRDRQGNRVTGTCWAWIASDAWTGYGYERPALELTLDKKLYQAGDTARVMISSPMKECYVLLTIEGRRLFHHQLIRMTSPVAMVNLEIPKDYTPNAFVCASLVKGKKFVEASEPLRVSPAGSFLTVRVESDKERYQPGEAATYRVRTLNAAGKGVPAQVALGVVDESLYAVREDMTPNIRRFFYGPKWSLVGTSVSFSQDYYGGEDKFQGKVRRYFPDTAYWNPVVLTDATGEASITFNMPDNLTTWRATARAVTLDTAVGSAVQKTLVTKNLLVRLQTPRFFRQRDVVDLGAVVHNYTNRQQKVKVWLESSGVTLGDRASRSLMIGPDGVGRTQWQVSVPHPGMAKITVYAQGQGDQDAMELQVPILPHGVQKRIAHAGQTTGNASFELKTRGDIIAQASSLKIGLSPSLASAALGIVKSLEDYNYGSAEGIMDVFLPNVVMYQAMKSLGRSSPEQYAKIQDMLKNDLRTVYDWQLPDGGWGWWEYGRKDPWMTAYVVYCLIRAKEAGLSVNESVLKKGIEATVASLPFEGDLGKRSTIVYVLALAGRAKQEWVDKILTDKKLQNYSCALTILSLVEMGDMDRARSLVPRLMKDRVESQLDCYWPEIFPWGFYSCNEYETTAYAIRALLAVDPDNPRIDKAVRWLVNRRKGDRYNANYDTASVVYALSDYLSVRNPVTPDFTARVYVNNRMVDEFKMDAESLYKPERELRVNPSALRQGTNTVRLEKSGPGELYYWALMKYYPSTEDVPAVKGKVSVTRSYYRLELTRDPKEGLVYKPRPLGDTARVGELVRCRLTIRAPKDFRYLMVEDMLPSGCEVARRPNVGFDWGWDYWWSGEIVHDDRVTFMLGEVYKGKRVIEYDFRPELRGRFHVMPAVAEGYFEPDIFAHSAEMRLSVK